MFALHRIRGQSEQSGPAERREVDVHGVFSPEVRLVLDRKLLYTVGLDCSTFPCSFFLST